MTPHNAGQQHHALAISNTKEFKTGIVKKVCNVCNIEKTIFQFPVCSEGHKYYWLNSFCRRCKTLKETKSRLSKTPEEQVARRLLAAKKQKRYTYPASQVLIHCRTTDTKKGKICDLDLAFVKNAIAKPCQYCNRDNVRRGLDRIDNSRGHTKDNVLPACALCNWLRMELPLNLWVQVSAVLKPSIIARELDTLCGGRFSTEKCAV